VRHLDRHLARLAKSAAELDFCFDAERVRERLAAHCAQLPAGVPHRVKLALSKGGQAEITGGALGPLARIADALRPGPGMLAPVGVLLADEYGFAPMRSGDFLLRHKSTSRAEYDRAWRLAEAKGGFDMLFFNERGELTEGGRSNVFAKLEDQWFTPPLSAGLLPGVMRQVLLEDAAMQAGERTLMRADLLRAESLIVCNALRGALPARILTSV